MKTNSLWLLFFSLFYLQLPSLATLSPKKHSSIVLNYNTPSDWNSFSNANSYASTASQERIAEQFTAFMQPTPLEQQWSKYAPQLTANECVQVFQENQRSLHAATEYPISLLNEFCPFKLESSSFFHRRWDNLIDLLQGTHQADDNPYIPRMVESVLTLCKLSFDQPELQNILLSLQTELKPLLFDNQGNVRFYLTSEEFRRFETLKNTYIQEIAQWYRYHGIEQCAKDALNSKYSYSAHGINSKTYLNSQGPLAQPFQQLQNTPAFKDLCELNILCTHDNFDAAYAIVQKYHSNSEGLHGVGNQNYFKEFYLHKFYQKHNFQDIRKEYLCDPLCQTLTHLPASEKPSEYNITLAARAAHKQEIFQKCQLHNPRELTVSIIYEMIDLHDNPSTVIDHVCSKLSSDHADPQHRASYHDLFDNSSKLKFIDSPHKTTAMPQIMNTARHSNERALFNKLLVSDYSFAKIDQALRALSNVGSSKYTQSYAALTNTLCEGILTHNDTLLALIPDFTAPIRSGQENCHKATIDFCANHLPSYKTDDKTNQRLVTISQAHKKMLTGDSLSHAFLEQAIATGTINYALIDAQQTKDYFGSENIPANTAHAESFAAVLNGHKECKQNAGQIFDFDYITSAAERIYCIAYGIAYEKYEHFRGNSIQFALFKLDLQNLKKGAELYAAQMNPTLRKVYEFGVQSNFLTQSFIKSRDYLNAMDLTTLVYKTFQYVDNSLNYMGHGIVEACAGIGEGFKDMPARVQELISNACNIKKRFATMHQQCCQTRAPIITFANIHSAIRNPALIIQGVRNCYTAIKDKLYATASNIYNTGIRGCSKIITQAGIEIYVLRKAEKILHAGQQALIEQATRLELTSNGQTPNHAERFIIDAEITQIEVSSSAHKASHQLIPEFTAAAEVESKVISSEGSKVPALAANAIQKVALNQKTPTVTSLQISQPPVGAETLSPANEALIKNFNPALYNPEVVNVDKLSKAVEMFAYTKGAMGQNGPLKQVLTNGKINVDEKISLKGPMYELEKAIDLANRGETIVEFGKKIQGREFDLVTPMKLIECKNINWEILNVDKINKLKSDFGGQNTIAQQLGCGFEVHSKDKIPSSLQMWLRDNNISFFEG